MTDKHICLFCGAPAPDGCRLCNGCARERLDHPDLIRGVCAMRLNMEGEPDECGRYALIYTDGVVAVTLHNGRYTMSFVEEGDTSRRKGDGGFFTLDLDEREFCRAWPRLRAEMATDHAMLLAKAIDSKQAEQTASWCCVMTELDALVTWAKARGWKGSRAGGVRDQAAEPDKLSAAAEAIGKGVPIAVGHAADGEILAGIALNEVGRVADGLPISIFRSGGGRFGATIGSTPIMGSGDTPAKALLDMASAVGIDWQSWKVAEPEPSGSDPAEWLRAKYPGLQAVSFGTGEWKVYCTDAHASGASEPEAMRRLALATGWTPPKPAKKTRCVLCSHYHPCGDVDIVAGRCSLIGMAIGGNTRQCRRTPSAWCPACPLPSHTSGWAWKSKHPRLEVRAECGAWSLVISPSSAGFASFVYHESVLMAAVDQSKTKAGAKRKAVKAAQRAWRIYALSRDGKVGRFYAEDTAKINPRKTDRTP